MKKYIVFLILISLLGLWPFFKKGYYQSHDGEWMVIRFTAFHQTLASGQLPVRFVDRLNNNYGYPVLNFLYPLPFYLAEIPKILGFGFVDSIKIVFILSSLTSVVATFWALSQVFDKKAAFTGAIIYLFIPYRFVDLYVRGSVGENLAFAFLPLVLGSIFKIAQGRKIFLPILSFSTAATILSHNVIAALFLPFFVISSAILIKKERTNTIAAFILGILIAAFFWVPAIFDLQFVKLSQIKVSQVSDHLVDITKLIIPAWGYGPNPNGQSPLPTQIGIVPLLILTTAVYLYIFKKIRETFFGFQLLIVTLIIILMLKISLPLWQILPYLDVIQFPWRMLSLVVFVSAILTAYVINLAPQKILLTLLVVGASIISTIAMTKPQNFVDRGDSYYSTNEDTTTVRDEYLPLWVKEKPKERAYQKIQIENAQLSSVHIKPANYRAQIKADQDTQVTVNTIYFPGWQAKVDGQLAPIDYQNKFGLITFNLPQGQHEVIISYAKTPVHLASEIASLAAMIITGVYFFLLWRK